MPTKLTPAQASFLKLLVEAGGYGRTAWTSYKPLNRLLELGLARRGKDRTVSHHATFYATAKGRKLVEKTLKGIKQ